MNTTSRAILQTVLATDASVSALAWSAAIRLIDGRVEALATVAGGMNERLLVTHKRASELLSVCRATIWRMTKDCLLNAVEIIPGTLRYPLREIVALTQKGVATELQRSFEKGKRPSYPPRNDSFPLIPGPPAKKVAFLLEEKNPA